MAVRPFTPLLALVVRLLLPPSCLCSEWDVPLFDPDFFTKPTAKPSSGKGTLGESASETGRISGRDAAYWIYPDVRFYEHGLCPHSHRVSLALHWLEIPHTSIEIDLSLPDEGLAWYRKRLGTATVPALEVDTIPSHGDMDLLRSLPTYATPAHRFIPKLRRERIAVEKILGCLATFEQAGWDLIAGGGEDGREVSRGQIATTPFFPICGDPISPICQKFDSVFRDGGGALDLQVGAGTRASLQLALLQRRAVPRRGEADRSGRCDRAFPWTVRAARAGAQGV